ncbi:MAG: transglutaminase domain-containing protein [Desulfobacteraceae bacterium]|nr:transglutaminase domain-containing protein [Desulfobacteraceae bacterium]
MSSCYEYLKPTKLCDFDQVHEIRDKARRLTIQLQDKGDITERIYHFVKELPYGLEDWDVKASETLRKGWGMCSGKTNLFVAMLRYLQIPTRYKVYKIYSEGTLWRMVASQNNKLAADMGEPVPQRDHVVAEVYLDKWQVYDPSRDSALEEGMKKLVMPLQRIPVATSDEKAQFLILNSIDEWASRRQQNLHFREGRQALFAEVNREFDSIRSLSSSRG